MDEVKQTVCIACSIFRNELEMLRNQGRFTLDTDYLDSSLHLYPQKLQAELDRSVRRHRDQQQRMLLLFGDCHAYMCDYAEQPDIVRTKGVNCCQIMLDSQAYHQLRGDGHFFLLPEWTLRWEEIIKACIGLPRDQARAFMREMHSGFIYLDTDVLPVPRQELDALSEFFGLSVAIERVGLEPLYLNIQQAFQDLNG